MSFPSQQPEPDGKFCYRHSSRPTNISCSNCDRPICEDCMRDSPVGWRCPECAPQRKYALADDYWVTKAVLAICIAVFLIGQVMALGDSTASGIRGDDPLLYDGGLAGIAVPDEPWRLLTAGFLHAGLLHLAFNSFFIWSFGRLLEPALGRLRFGLLYFASLFGGSLGALLLTDPSTLTVGASGAAFGLLGATIVMARLRNIAGLEQNLLFIAGINFVLTFTIGGISVGGHLGGFAVGLLGGWIAFGPLARNRPAVSGILAAALVVLAIAGYLVGQAQVA